MEKVLWLIERVNSGLWSFALEISRWTMLYNRVDQLKLIVIKLRHSFRTIKGIPCRRQLPYSKYPNQLSYWWKWKKCLLLYGKKTKWTFWPTQKIGSKVRGNYHTDMATLQSTALTWPLSPILVPCHRKEDTAILFRLLFIYLFPLMDIIGSLFHATKYNSTTFKWLLYNIYQDFIL